MGLTDLASVALSAAALIAVMWQIARTEGMQPQDGGQMARQVIAVTDEYSDLTVAYRVSGPATLYEATMLLWGCAFVGDAPEARPVLDARSEPVIATVRVPHGAEAYVGIAWMYFSPIMRRPVYHVVRRRLDTAEPVWERWKWAWLARPWPRPRYGRGHWRWNDLRFGRNRLDLPAGAAPSSAATEALRGVRLFAQRK